MEEPQAHQLQASLEHIWRVYFRTKDEITSIADDQDDATTPKSSLSHLYQKYESSRAVERKVNLMNALKETFKFEIPFGTAEADQTQSDIPNGTAQTQHAKKSIITDETSSFLTLFKHPCIAVAKVPGKGRGLVATQEIQPGTLLYIEEALITSFNQKDMQSKLHCLMGPSVGAADQPNGSKIDSDATHIDIVPTPVRQGQQWYQASQNNCIWNQSSNKSKCKQMTEADSAALRKLFFNFSDGSQESESQLMENQEQSQNTAPNCSKHQKMLTQKYGVQFYHENRHVIDQLIQTNQHALTSTLAHKIDTNTNSSISKSNRSRSISNQLELTQWQMDQKLQDSKNDELDLILDPNDRQDSYSSLKYGLKSQHHVNYQNQMNIKQRQVQLICDDDKTALFLFHRYNNHASLPNLNRMILDFEGVEPSLRNWDLKLNTNDGSASSRRRSSTINSISEEVLGNVEVRKRKSSWNSISFSDSQASDQPNLFDLELSSDSDSEKDNQELLVQNRNPVCTSEQGQATEMEQKQQNDLFDLKLPKPSWKPITSLLFVRASRHVRKGEELCDTYANVMKPKHERDAKFKERGFIPMDLRDKIENLVFYEEKDQASMIDFYLRKSRKISLEYWELADDVEQLFLQLQYEQKYEQTEDSQIQQNALDAKANTKDLRQFLSWINQARNNQKKQAQKHKWSKININNQNSSNTKNNANNRINSAGDGIINEDFRIVEVMSLYQYQQCKLVDQILDLCKQIENYIQKLLHGANWQKSTGYGPQSWSQKRKASTAGNPIPNGRSSRSQSQVSTPKSGGNRSFTEYQTRLKDGKFDQLLNLLAEEGRNSEIANSLYGEYCVMWEQLIQKNEDKVNYSGGDVNDKVETNTNLLQLQDEKQKLNDFISSLLLASFEEVLSDSAYMLADFAEQSAIKQNYFNQSGQVTSYEDIDQHIEVFSTSRLNFGSLKTFNNFNLDIGKQIRNATVRPSDLYSIGFELFKVLEQQIHGVTVPHSDRHCAVANMMLYCSKQQQCTCTGTGTGLDELAEAESYVRDVFAQTYGYIDKHKNDEHKIILDQDHFQQNAKQQMQLTEIQDQAPQIRSAQELFTIC